MSDVALQIEGYAACFGVPDAGGDTIMSGAFRDTLAGPRNRIVMLFAHDAHKPPIGIWDMTAFEEDDIGLKVRGVVGDFDMAKAVIDGRIFGLSIGYRKRLVRYVGDVRHMLEIELFEVSLVPVPMHPGALITAWSETRALELRLK